MKIMKDPYWVLFFGIAGINLIMAIAMNQHTNFQIQLTADIESKLIELDRTIDNWVIWQEQADFQSGNQSKRQRYNGMYWSGNDYYCIWVKEREPLNIKQTEAHEICHSLIDFDNESHFCK